MGTTITLPLPLGDSGLEAEVGLYLGSEGRDDPSEAEISDASISVSDPKKFREWSADRLDGYGLPEKD